MSEEKKIELKPIDKDFGTGVYCGWEDNEEKNVLITEWGQYEKDTDKGKKLCFRATVLNIDGRKYEVGEKMIDTTSIAFQKAIKPYILEAMENEDTTLCLRIIRVGEGKDTKYSIKKIKPFEINGVNEEKV
jgi:hypothetical protein